MPTQARTFCPKRLRVVMILLVLLGPCAFAQYDEGTSAFGVGLQVYPTGIIPGIQVRTALTNRNALTLHLGLNSTDRRDLGEHESEEGSGAGAGLGLRHSFASAHRGLFVGVRNDFWFLTINWFDDNRTRRGTSDVAVVQPAAQLGYVLSPGRGRLDLEFSVSLGREFNFRTKGEDVGQGYILLGGLSVGYRLPSPA